MHLLFPDGVAWRKTALTIALAWGACQSLPHSRGQLGDRPGESQQLHHSWKIPPSPALTPHEALETFRIEEGYRLERVAAEPLVQDPVAMAFDELGRLWVAEMRGFMPRLDATEEEEAEPVGRIVVLEDRDGDGEFEHRRVFLDKLVSPRAVACCRGGILVNDGNALYHVFDTDSDGIGDLRTLVDPDYIRGGNVEHQPNGLLLGLDGWYYSAKSERRYRFHEGRWEIEETERRGQWGITRDDHGRLFYNYNWDQLRGDLAPPNALQRNPHHTSVTGINLAVATDQGVHPIRTNTGVNRGYRPGILDDSGKLRAFASACAPHIYRGHMMPELGGQAFVCGPGANLVKRNILSYGELSLSSHPAPSSGEFLASTDERFRPVFLGGGPDGALYLVDMYRGVIQHRAFMTTYLRGEIESRGLASPVHLGRIYRAVPAHLALTRAHSPALPSGSVEDLAHPNGWHRDTAQRLLVERNDRTVIPALRSLALHSNNPLAQTHALWALACLEDDHPELLLPLTLDHHAGVAATAIRVLERLSPRHAAFVPTLAEHLITLAASAPLPVRFQIALTLGAIDSEPALLVSALAGIARRDAAHPMMRDAIMSSAAGQELSLLGALWHVPHAAPDLLPLLEALGSSVVKGRATARVSALIERLGDDPSQWDARHEAVVAGMVVHADQRRFEPIHLPSEPEILRRMDEIPRSGAGELLPGWRRLFAWPGHTPARNLTESGRPLTDEEARHFQEGRRLYSTLCASCHATDGEGITPIAPPLLDSEWVLGDPGPLIRILLQGLEGPIHVNGSRYAPPAIQPMMPPLTALSDTELAAILTYVRRAWGHGALPLASQDVTRIRTVTADRWAPWTERELRALTLQP